MTKNNQTLIKKNNPSLDAKGFKPSWRHFFRELKDTFKRDELSIEEQLRLIRGRFVDKPMMVKDRVIIDGGELVTKDVIKRAKEYDLLERLLHNTTSDRNYNTSVRSSSVQPWQAGTDPDSFHQEAANQGQQGGQDQPASSSQGETGGGQGSGGAGSAGGGGN